MLRIFDFDGRVSLADLMAWMGSYMALTMAGLSSADGTWYLFSTGSWASYRLYGFCPDGLLYSACIKTSNSQVSLRLASTSFWTGTA